MIERIKARIRHLLGWQTPTEYINSIDIGKCIDEGVGNYQRTEALNNVVKSGIVKCLGNMSDDDMEAMIAALTRGKEAIKKEDRAGTVFADIDRGESDDD